MTPTSTPRLSYGRTLIIGLGFFTTSLCWALYNAYVPIFLGRFLTSAALIGLVMTLDNWAAIALQPWIGALSDRTRTRLGRRLPYLALGIPLSAALFALLPFFALAGPGPSAPARLPLLGEFTIAAGLLPLIGVIMLFNVAMAIYRAPVVALMPDVTPSIHRSRANGLINLMGGVGSILAYLVGSYLYELGVPVPFVTAAGVMVLALAALLLFVREPSAGPPATTRDGVERPGALRAIRDIFRSRQWSALFILLALYCWFFGFNSLETWFTTYGVHVLGIRESAAARILTSVSLFFVLFALPAGLLGTRVGRRKAILAGVALFAVSLTAMAFIRTVVPLYFLFALAGTAWALINVNSIPIIWELASPGLLGTYTGLYYLFSSLAQITAPPLSGLFTDRIGLTALFPLAIVFFVLAFLLMLGVRGGEAVSVSAPPGPGH